MGWLFGWNSKTELVRHLVGYSDGSLKTIDHALRGNNLWAVCEVAPKVEGAAPDRFIVLYLLSGSGSGSPKWGYKDIDEGMGPVEDSCPLRFLTLAPLSENGGPYAKDFRERVKAYHEKKLATRRAVKEKTTGLAPGCRVRLKTGLSIHGVPLLEAQVRSVKPLIVDTPYGKAKIRRTWIEAVL